MGYVVGQLVPWPMPPDWARGIRERLAWKTDGKPAMNGVRQKFKLRGKPRRGFEIEVIADGPERQLLNAALADRGGAVWQLPIYHDVQRLAVDVTLGATAILAETAGFDFVVGGRALLWRSANDWELVVIDAIFADSLLLTDPTAMAWPAGTRLYPVRSARIQEWPSERSWNDNASRRTVSFEVSEPCAWPAVLPPATYRNYPVLELRTDEGEDPTWTSERTLEVHDAEVGPVTAFDWPDVPFRRISFRWLCGTRAEHSAMRSLLYALAGQQLTLWVSSGASDLRLKSTTAAASTTLSVEWCGYTVFGRGQLHCRDIRIELRNGSVLYRRITAWAQAPGIETLTLDSPPGVDLTVANVRQISYLVLSEQGSDTVEIEHITDADGLTRASTTFRAVKRDV